jgi:hypothetical protein
MFHLLCLYVFVSVYWYVVRTASASAKYLNTGVWGDQIDGTGSLVNEFVKQTNDLKQCQ